jgi:hypothetical protein
MAAKKRKRPDSGEGGRERFGGLVYVENTASRIDSQISCRATDSKSDGQFCLLENAPLKNASVRLVQRKTQSAALLRLLIDAHGSWVPLPEILALGIAQYNARILELRRRGFAIENKTERVNGARHSWFRLVQIRRESAL